MHNFLIGLWYWFWYFRRGNAKFWVKDLGDTFVAYGTNGKITVKDCYGSTPEQALELARLKFKNTLEDNKYE